MKRPWMVVPTQRGLRTTIRGKHFSNKERIGTLPSQRQESLNPNRYSDSGLGDESFEGLFYLSF